MLMQPLMQPIIINRDRDSSRFHIRFVRRTVAVFCALPFLPPWKWLLSDSNVRLMLLFGTYFVYVFTSILFRVFHLCLNVNLTQLSRISSKYILSPILFSLWFQIMEQSLMRLFCKFCPHLVAYRTFGMILFLT